MRRGQSSIEAVLATTLLCLLLSAAGTAALASWRSAELAVGRIAADRAASRGGDPRQAAAEAVPPILRDATETRPAVAR